MGDDPGTSQVVVGVDGSETARRALLWASSVAGTGTLHVVHSPEADDADDAAPPWFAALVGRAGTVPHLVAGEPAAVILAVAEEVEADLVVVGPHGRGALEPRRLGRVATRLLHETSRPLAVVPDGATPPPDTGGTVVVGIGHGPATRVALDWAARFAADHDAALSLVHAVLHRPVFRDNGLLDVIAYYLDPAKIREWALEDLEDLATEIRRSTEDEVAVSWSAPAGRVGPTLVEAGADASLLVLGRHHDGEWTATIVPTALRHTLVHAPCPVVMVPVPESPA